MSGKQYEIGIQINGDGSVFVREAARSEKAAVKLGEAVGGIEKSTHGLNDSAARATIGIGQLADQVGSVGRLFSALVVAPALISSIRDTGKALFDASANAERLRTQLAFSTGNADREFDFLLKLSNRLGLEFRSTAQAYAGFAAATRDTALEGQAARDVFEAIAKASAVMGLSAEQSSGALLAIQQMMSKGVVSAEEFRGQLGERMPIALQAGAKALGVTASEFSKLMESGKIVSDEFLPKFARAITETLGDAPEKAANRLDASTARMASAWDRLKQAGGDSGVSKAIASDMNALAATANAMTESMAQSAQRGEGSLLQFANAAGVLIGRSTLGGIAATAETVNGSINLLSGGMFRLSTNISLLPDSLRPAAEQLTSIDGKLKTARTEYEALAERVGKAPENIYLRSELAQLGNYIARLKEARSQQALLSGVGLPENYGNEGRGATQQKAADDAALAASQKRAKAYAEVIEKYQTPAEKMGKALREAKESLGEFFTPDVERRIRESFKKGDAGLANDASQIFQARLATEKDYISTSVKLIAEKVRQNVLTEREGFEQTAAIQQAGYVAQAKLLKQRLAETTDKGEREKLKQQIIALGNDAQEAAEKAATGIMLIAEKELKAQQEYSHGLAGETEALLQKAKAADLELGTIGLSAEKLAELTARRYDEQIAIKTAEANRLRESQGREADVHLIEQQIDALTRLKSAEITKTKLQEQAREWDSFSRDIQRSLTDSLYRGLEKGGKDGAKLARETIVNTLKAIPIKIAVQAIVQPVIGSAQQAFGMNGGAGGVGSVGGAMNLFSAGKNILSGINGSPFASGFDKLAASAWGQSALYAPAQGIQSGGMMLDVLDAGSVGQLTELGGTLKAGAEFLDSYGGYINAAYQLSQGKYGAAVGAAIGQMTPLGPIGSVIGSTIGSMLDSAFSSDGAPKSAIGGGGRITATGVDYNVAGLPHWTDYTAQSQQLASSIVTDQLVTALHKINAGYTGSAYFKGEINSKGSSSNQTLAQATNAAGQVVYHRFVESGKGAEDFQRAAAAEIPKLQLALMVDAMRGAGGEIKSIADSVVGTAGDLTAALSGMDSGAVAAATANLVGLSDVFEQLKTSLSPTLTGEAAVSLAKMAGGAQALVTASAGYTDAVLGDAEKQAQAWSQLERSFAALQQPVAKTTAELKKQVDAQDLSTEAGQRTALALMALAPALKSLTTAAEQQRQQLQNRIDELTGNTAAIRARELAALDPSNRALQQRIYSLEAEASAAQKAAEIANQRAGLQNTLDQLLGNTVAIRTRELSALDQSNRALQERIWAIEDERSAAEASRAAQEASKSAAQTAFGRLQEAVNAQKQGYSATLNAEKESIQARLKAQQEAGRAQIDAARATADSIRSIAGSLKSAIKAVDIDSPLENFARLNSARDLIRRAGETGDLKLPGLEDALQVAAGDSKQYYSRFEDYAFAQATTGAVIDNLYSRASAQLNTQESIVSALESQMASAQTIADAQIAAAEEAYRQQEVALDATLNQGESQLNALLGIDKSVLSVADAVAGLSAAIGAAQSAQSAALAAAQAQTQAAIQAAAQKTSLSGGGASVPGSWFDSGGWVDSSNTWHPNVENSPWYGGAGAGLDYATLQGIFGTGNVPGTASGHAYGGALSAADWQAVKAAADPTAAYRDIFRDRVGATVADWAVGGESGAAIMDRSGGTVGVLVGNSAQEIAQGAMSSYGVSASGTGIGAAAASEIVASAIGQYGAGAESAGQQIYAQAQALGLTTASIAEATGQTVQSIQDWISARGLGSLDGSHAGGLSYVPFDGYRAELHEGEAVVSAPEVRAIRRYFGAPAAGSAPSNAELAEALRRIADRLDAIETNTRAGAISSAGVNRKFDRVIRGDKLKIITEAA